MRKTILLLNLRFADFYSKELFSLVKEKFGCRIVAIVDQQFYQRIASHVEPYLDCVYFVEAQPKDGFLAEFDIDAIRPIVVEEMQGADDLKIVCSDEFNLLIAGRLRRELNLYGHTDEDLLVFRDKIKMKKCLQHAGVRVPRFKSISSKVSFDSIAKEVGLPFVIKPIDSCGSYGVYIIHDEARYLDFTSANHAGKFEAEEYISGELYHVDSQIMHKELKFICANEYTFPNYQYTEGRALGSIPLDNESELSMELMEFAWRALMAIKADNMINHMELFVTKEKEIVFLEVSARPPGALVNAMHKNNFGINLIDQDFLMQSGLDLDLQIKKKNEYAFWTLFPLLPGKIKKLNQPVVQSRYDIAWFVEQDYYVEEERCKNIVSKAAHAMFYNANKALLYQDFDLIKQHQAVEVVSHGS